MKPDETTTHESFGIAGFSRSSIGGNGIPLFGSSILHNNVITFTVSHGSVDRKLGQDWYGSDGRIPIVQITMSQAQFAEMITSMNIGDGIPVTINQINGKYMEGCPYQNKRMKHANEFKLKMKEFAARIDAYKADMLKMSAKLPKKDQEELKNMIKSLSQEVASNIPFYDNQFTRQMNKTITEAKSEIESFVEGKIRSTGLEALKEQIKMIDKD